jgi:hypothetical protein
MDQAYPADGDNLLPVLTGREAPHARSMRPVKATGVQDFVEPATRSSSLNREGLRAPIPG